MIVVSDEIAALSKVKQQQTIYAPLMTYFTTGEIHALTIKTYTTEKWKIDRLYINPVKLGFISWKNFVFMADNPV
ncbi:BolA family protein [Rodentibacter pneumotropicus]|uniref:BolA family protein n=1 Tax=Rodentibacter pneumotropicus TaxID=758 RepID=A0A3S4W136_9PAST|nr:BolA family protein [Rodentibacter pneumotropicus]